MENIIGKISRWMAADRPKQQTSEDDVKIAAAALMIHAMRIDDESHPAEQDRVRSVLKSHFDLDQAELDTLVERARSEDDAAVDLYRFTKLISANMDQPGRLQIVRMLWEVVLADGHIHEFEANLVWRVAELIGVTRDERIRLRQDVAGSSEGG